MEGKTRSPETCGDPSHSVPLYITELVNQNFFYTISVTDTSTIINVYDYILEGVAARVFITQELSTIPLFRLVTPGSGRNLYVSTEQIPGSEVTRATEARRVPMNKPGV
ncbi:hypothetical protein B0H14DRAFT_3507617 [Mycena olivaceomarginata]|nr:hypothetical protein B0H14DRAFT_3507617 [Mycena olivaceomarginata]